MSVRWVFAAFAVGAFIACSGDDQFVSLSTIGPTGATTLVDAGSNEIVPFCSTVTAGDGCEGAATATCELGSSADVACNAMLECENHSTWQVVAAARATCPGSCPNAYRESNAGACENPDAGAVLCEFPEGTCGCGATDAGDAGPTYAWRCVQPDRDAGCPRTRPRVGDACVRPLRCDYGRCVLQDGVEMDCYAGFWGLARSTGCE